MSNFSSLYNPGQTNLTQYHDSNGLIVGSGTVTVGNSGAVTFSNTNMCTTGGLQLGGNNTVTISPPSSHYLLGGGGEGIYYGHNYSPYNYPIWDNPPYDPYYFQISRPSIFPQITFPFSYNIMKTQTKYLDNKFQLIAELAGFKKEEVKVKYFNPDKNDKNCSTQSYIQVIAESKNHVLKLDGTDVYKLEQTFYIDKSKNLNFDSVKLTFVDGLLVIEVEYDETSKIKELPLQ